MLMPERLNNDAFGIDRHGKVSCEIHRDRNLDRGLCRLLINFFEFEHDGRCSCHELRRDRSAGSLHTLVGAERSWPVGQLAKPYFISFRARNAESYGHSFVAFGELDSRGNVPYDNGGVLISNMTEIAGLHPAGGNAVYSMGHIAPVPSETGFSDGDTEIRYLQNEMTIALTPEEYQRVLGRIRQLQGNSPLWHAVAYNCSTFTNKIADFMGMETVNHLLFPRNYIAALKNANTKKSAARTGFRTVMTIRLAPTSTVAKT